MAVSVIVPFHRGLHSLHRVVGGITGCTDVAETIVVANGSNEDLSEMARLPRVRIVSLPAACGPAVARNRGAAVAGHPILVFIDSDVVPHADAISVMVDDLADDRLTAVFGAYDHSPGEPGFFSQYRNLAHAFVHEQAHADARTFWGGLGAVRAEAFRAIHGFDERFTRPSIEDIDLGYRLSQAGYRLRLNPAIRGTHLKRWTLASSIVIDVRDRGVPWMQALLKYDALDDDLNVSWRGRLALVFACTLSGALIVTPVWPPAIWAAAAAGAGFLATHAPMLRFFARERGIAFAAGVAAAQIVHHLCNGVSMIAGIALWSLQRIAGWRTAWTLPAARWPAD